MQVGMLKRIVIIALVGMMAGIPAMMSPKGTAWSAEKDKPAEKEKPAQKEKPAKKPKTTQPTQKGRFSEGATKASGAGIVDKSTACFGQAPKIEKVSPDEAKAGDKVTISGKDFGLAGCLASISFGPGNQAKFEQKNETEVTATVPSIKKKGLVILTLTTASGEDSKPVLIK